MNRVKSPVWTLAPVLIAAVTLAVGGWLGGLSGTPAIAQEEEAPTADQPRVALETNQGTIVLELYPAKAPKTVENFLGYVDSGFYDGTIFHRVIPGFMIQGGGFTPDLQQKATEAPVQNEADNGLENNRGTVAMARTGNPHSATAQFFVNVVDNDYLNHTAKTPQGWGYTVFGHVVEGMEVVDEISRVRTTRRGSYSNLPAEAIVIQTARRADDDGAGDDATENDSDGR